MEISDVADRKKGNEKKAKDEGETSNKQKERMKQRKIACKYINEREKDLFYFIVNNTK